MNKPKKQSSKEENKHFVLRDIPKEVEMIFELPVRKRRHSYEVWTGKNWTKIYIKMSDPKLNKTI